MMVWVSGERAPSHEEVRASTGRRWAEWLQELDQWDGDKTSLRHMVNFLVSQHNVTPHWAQVIALYYQVERL
jgi:hypothetical protein